MIYSLAKFFSSFKYEKRLTPITKNTEEYTVISKALEDESIEISYLSKEYEYRKTIDDSEINKRYIYIYTSTDLNVNEALVIFKDITNDNISLEIVKSSSKIYDDNFYRKIENAYKAATKQHNNFFMILFILSLFILAVVTGIFLIWLSGVVVVFIYLLIKKKKLSDILFNSLLSYGYFIQMYVINKQIKTPSSLF